MSSGASRMGKLRARVVYAGGACIADVAHAFAIAEGAQQQWDAPAFIVRMATDEAGGDVVVATEDCASPGILAQYQPRRS